MQMTKLLPDHEKENFQVALCLKNINCYLTILRSGSVRVAGNCENQTFPEMPRQYIQVQAALAISGFDYSQF